MKKKPTLDIFLKVLLSKTMFVIKVERTKYIYIFCFKFLIVSTTLEILVNLKKKLFVCFCFFSSAVRQKDYYYVKFRVFFAVKKNILFWKSWQMNEFLKKIKSWSVICYQHFFNFIKVWEIKIPLFIFLKSRALWRICFLSNKHHLPKIRSES